MVPSSIVKTDYLALELRVLAHQQHQRNREQRLERMLARIRECSEPERRAKMKNIATALAYGASLLVITRSLRGK